MESSICPALRYFPFTPRLSTPLQLPQQALIIHSTKHGVQLALLLKSYQHLVINYL